MTVNKDRRRMLGALAATGGAMLLSSVPAALARQQLPIKSALLAVLSHPEGARSIGHEYLKQFPAESHAGQLVGLIVDRNQRMSGATAGLEETREFLQQAVRADFHEDKTVELKGWVLSRTEARLCALACLG